MQEYTRYGTARSQGAGLPPLPESNNPLSWAEYYTARGWHCVPVPLGEKGPPYRGWQHWRLSFAELPRWFADGKHLIGLLLGAPSGLVDIDLDSEPAQRLARHFLPPTNARHGRLGRITHWWYTCQNPQRTVRRVDPSLTGANGERLTLVELRGTGGHTLAPCGLPHPTGGQLEWASFPPEPAECDWDTLMRAVDRLAAASLLALRWQAGRRHELALALGGWLAKAGWAQGDAERLVEAVCEAAGDAEWRDRLDAVRDSYERAARGEQVLGVSGLLDALHDEPAVRALAQWLRIPYETDGARGRRVDGEARGRRAAGATLAESILRDAVEQFVDADGRAGVTLQNGDAVATYWVESKAFEGVLLAHAGALGIAPRAAVLDEARATLIGACWRSGRRLTPALRVAGEPGTAVYVDLGDDPWRVVHITADGWRVRPYSTDLPIRFVRPAGMLALPTPQHGGDIGLLRRFVRLPDESFLLLVAWLIGCYLPDLQYPILALSGAPGSGKSYTTRLLRQLVDPRSVPFSALPRDAGDLWAYAVGSYLLAFDNASRIDAELSDLLCGAATEGGAELRQYHTRLERVGIRFRRPVLLNGVPSLAQKSDLADRFIALELQPIPDTERRTETALRAEWEQVYPLVLGSLFDGVSSAIRHWGRITIPLPRLGDFALWAAGGLRAYGVEPAQFLEWYTGNRLATAQDLAESSALCEGVRLLLADRDEWRGTPSELLNALRERLGDRREQLPGSPRHLSSRLRMETPLLHAMGVAVETGREGKMRQRVIRLWRVEADATSGGGRYENLASALASASEVKISCVDDGEADAKTGADAKTPIIFDLKIEGGGPGAAAIESEKMDAVQRPSRPPDSESQDFARTSEISRDLRADATADATSELASAGSRSVRHDPDLTDLLAHRRDGHALVERLWAWARERDFPSLEIAPGTRIIGCKSAWLAFLRTAESDKLARAAQASGCDSSQVVPDGTT